MDLKTEQEQVKHTPGPWIACFYPNSKGQIVNIKIWAPDEFHGNLVCAMSPETPASVQGNESFANARLIAAAPDFLEACTGDEIPQLHRIEALTVLLKAIDDSVLECVEDPQAWREAIAECWQMERMLRDAIAKAEGNGRSQ